MIKFYNISDEPDYKIIDIIGDKINNLLISGEILRFLRWIKFKLNKQIVIKYQEKFLEYYNILPKDLSVSPFFSLDEEFKTKMFSLYNIPELKIEENKSNYSNLPFFKSLKYFREINSRETILDKLEIMFNLRNIILTEIDDFWKGFPYLEEKRLVDADNLLSIFIYLVIKSQLVNLIIDIEIINDFINKSLKLSRKGILSLTFRLLLLSGSYFIRISSK